MNYSEMKKALRNEIHFIEYPKDIIIQAGKNIGFEYCNYCNTKLEEKDKLNVKISRVTSYNCSFCFSKN